MLSILHRHVSCMSYCITERLFAQHTGYIQASLRGLRHRKLTPSPKSRTKDVEANHTHDAQRAQAS